MPKHGKRVPWWRLRAAYRDLVKDYQRLARMHRLLQTEHAAYLEQATGDGPAPGQTTWGWVNELAGAAADTQPLPLPGLDPDKAGALVRNAGLLEQPGFGPAASGHTPV